jgi:uncharacterized protein YkwD
MRTLLIALAAMPTLATAACSTHKSGGADRRPASGYPAEDQDGAKTTTGQPKKVDEKSSTSTKKKTAKADEREDDADAKVSAACYKGDNAVCAIEEKVFELVNAERAKAGLAALEFSPRVSFVARDWSEEQASERRISHDGWPQAREAAFRDEFGTDLGTDAENVAMIGGASAATVARQLMDMWMGSPGHRLNILGRHHALGVGVAERGDGEWYATQLFTFGDPE